MIAPMRDLQQVDRELAELGRPPSDVRLLLGRVLGEDRSLARLEQLLGELETAAPLAAPEPPRRHSSWPPRPSVGPRRIAEVKPPVSQSPPAPRPVPHDTIVDGPSSPIGLPDAEEHGLEAEAAALISDLHPPQEAAGASADEAAASEPARAPGEGLAFSALFDFSEPPPPRVSSAPAPAPEAPSADGPRSEEQETGERPASMRALLDQDLDPNDFPAVPAPRQAEPEPAPRQSEPEPAPAPAPARAQSQPVEVEDEFELLVDDEIIELVEDELEIVDEDGEP